MSRSVGIARGRRDPDLRGLAVGLPGTMSTDDRLDIKEAAQILDEDHYGLEKIKERILEYLAVRSLADTIGADPAVRRPARRGQDAASARASPGRWAASSRG